MKKCRGLIMACSGVVLMSCADSPSESTVQTPSTVVANGRTVVVEVLDNSFRAIEITIRAGTEVRFENRGRNDHNILPDSLKNETELTALLASESSAWGVVSALLTPKQTYSHVFGTAGIYRYYCAIHGLPGKAMYGIITVT